MERTDSFRGCLLGLAVGDAVGTTVEFQPRGTFSPVTDMVGGGPFGLPAGAWTDDTSMALCLATSLVETGGFDPADQMGRYLRWRDEGYLSSIGRCFDIGNTIANALGHYEETGEPFSGSTDPHSAGNGSIMRLAPVPMFYAADLEQAVYFSGESSRTTHGAAECVDACRLLGSMLVKALVGQSRETILFDNEELGMLAPNIQRIAAGEYRRFGAGAIKGSGYVVESLQAALWSFWRTDNFRDAILMAVNLGDDSDTTAAVCGQLAGAFYGAATIPERWLELTVMKDEIVTLADRLAPR